MSTITIRLPKGLKTRVAAAAKRAGTTAHGFILEAIAEKTDREAQRADFLETAEKRYANIVASSKTIPWSKMRSYLENRVPLRRGDRHGLRACAVPLRPMTLIPAAEAWAHEPAMRDQLRRAGEWANRTPPAVTKLDKLAGNAAKRAGKRG